jgi:putative ABC transport system permease protein
MGVFYLTLRYLCFYRARSVLLLVCLTVTVCLPVGLRLLIRHYRAELVERAKCTPLVFGAHGQRYDLAMSALYFRTNLDEAVSMADYDELRDTGFAENLPLFVRHTARGVPIAGVTADYFRFRHLTTAAGRPPAVLGEAALGSNIAGRLQIGVGDCILSDQSDLYNLAAAYPLRMKIVGVLAPTNSADDEAIFCDIKTAWVIAGIGHGHRDLSKPGEAGNVLSRKGGNIVGNENVATFVEITDDNRASFHFHAERGGLPVTCIICVPKDDKSATLLKGRYKLSKTRQFIVPTEVVDEILAIVLKVEAFLQASFALIALCTSLLVALIVLLTTRLRWDEMETLHKIGCSRWFVAGMQVAEWCCILLASLLLATVIIALTLWAAPNLQQVL